MPGADTVAGKENSFFDLEEPRTGLRFGLTGFTLNGITMAVATNLDYLLG
jgi:hypothetical protein